MFAEKMLMNRRTVQATLLASVLLVAAGSSASAASVGLKLVLDPPVPGCVGCTLSGPGTYNVLARASDGDNFGISRYDVTVRDVLSIINRSPRTIVDPEADALPAGFTLLRSANNQDVVAGGFNFHAVQDTVTPTPYLIRGFGQETSSFAAKIPGHAFGSPQTQTSWNANLLIAEGTHLPGASPHIDLSGTTTGVFVNASGIQTQTAIVYLVPEPSGVVLASMMGLVVLSRFRSRRRPIGGTS
jgi:hypothetical protein